MKTILLRSLCVLLMLAGLLMPAPVKAAVRSYGMATSTGENITVQVFADIADVFIVSFGCKVFYDVNVLEVVQATKNEAVWYFFDGANQIAYMDPDTSQPGEVLFVGGRMDARDSLGGVTGNGVLLGTVVFRRLTRDTPTFDVSIGREGDYANFVTREGATLDVLPGEVTFSEVSPDPGDKDLDSLRDDWEIEFFEKIELAYYADDPDEDGTDNRGEEALGTDPTDPASNFRLLVFRQLGEVLLQWPATEKRVYRIDGSDDLIRFDAIETGIEATPPVNSYRIKIPKEAGPSFYRVSLEDSANR